MLYLPNSVYVEEKGVFNIISAPKSTILPAIGMAVANDDKRSVYLTDKNTEIYQSLKVFHKRLGLFQWDYPEQIISRLNRSRPELAIIEYNRYFFKGVPGKISNEKQAIIEYTGGELKKLAESSNGTYIMISPFMDENLKILCECADRVLIVDDNNRNKNGDFIFKDRTTGCYVKRQKTIADFS